MDIFCPSRSGERSGVSEAPSGIVADLQDLLALGLTADPGRTPLAKVSLREPFLHKPSHSSGRAPAGVHYHCSSLLQRRPVEAADAAAVPRSAIP